MALERPDLLSPLKERGLYDPLSEVTRAERKLLLLVSLICLALTWSDLLPTRVEALGIEISTADRLNLILLLGLTLLYFLVAFITYVLADFAQWRVARDLAQRTSSEAVAPIAVMAKDMSANSTDDERLNILSFVSTDLAVGRTVLRRIRFRTWFELIVPLLAASVAVLSVVAELSGFDDPDNLLTFTWNAAPTPVLLILILVLLLIVSIYRRKSGPRFRSPLRFRLGHRIIALGKLVPFSKRLQQGVLRLGLKVMTGGRSSSSDQGPQADA